MRWLIGSARLRPGFLGALILVWTVIAFLPAVRNDFVNWDDFRMFLDNVDHKGPWESRFWAAWTSHRLGEYMPVTWMTFAVDRSFWRDDATGYHLTSLLLHACTAVAVLALARRLLRIALGPGPEGSAGLWGGAAVAALAFAVHPLRVEAVAWASARGTVVGGLLLVLCVLVYVDGWEHRGGDGRVPLPWLLGSLGLFAASLLARATGLVLPLVLITLDVFPLGRLGRGPRSWLAPANRGVWAEKLWFGVLGLVTVPMAYLARGDQVGDIWRFDYDPSIAVTWGVYSTAFYVWKMVLPGDLSPIYRMPGPDDLMLGPVLLGLGVIIGITAAVTSVRRQWPAALTAWIVYLIMLAPLSGILPFSRQRGVADRYTYVACLGFAIVGGGAATLTWRAFRTGYLRRSRAIVIGMAIVLVLISWTALSWQQTKVWRNGLTLWGWALHVAPDSPVVRNNLGWAWAQTGEFARAEVHARRAADAWPNNPIVLQTLARILAAQGHFEEAIETLLRAVEVSPRWQEGHTDLGSILHESGDNARAVAHLERALRLDPGEARTHEYLARALTAMGREKEAEQHLRVVAMLNGQPWPPDPGITILLPVSPGEPTGGGFRP